MRKALLAILLAAAATPCSAAVTILFNNPSGELGDDQDYTSGSMTVTASGYAADLVDEHLYGKDEGVGEEGLGLIGDPSGQNEIYEGGAFITLDVTQILDLASGMAFFMNSTTDGEQWSVYGSSADDVLGTLLFSGGDEQVWHDLTGWGTYDFYQFASDNGNVLLGGVSITEAVPEPGTWAMMLLGFGAAGFALRRRKQTQLTFRQAA